MIFGLKTAGVAVAYFGYHIVTHTTIGVDAFLVGIPALVAGPCLIIKGLVHDTRAEKAKEENLHEQLSQLNKKRNWMTCACGKT